MTKPLSTKKSPPPSSRAQAYMERQRWIDEKSERQALPRHGGRPVISYRASAATWAPSTWSKRRACLLTCLWRKFKSAAAQSPPSVWCRGRSADNRSHLGGQAIQYQSLSGLRSPLRLVHPHDPCISGTRWKYCGSPRDASHRQTAGFLRYGI